MGDGDGWVICSLGHRHWGRYGAAGLLITDGERSVLQHRAPWTHEGDTWALVGGARDSHEDVVSAALREAREEAALDSSTLSPVGLLIDDHGGWSYTSVIAGPLAPISPHAANAESSEIRWWTNPEIEALPLHHGFAGMWPRLRALPPRLVVLVDGRSGALRPGSVDLDHAHQVARAGVRTAELPFDAAGLHLDVLLPYVTMFVAAAPKDAGAIEGRRPQWWHRAVRLAQRPSSEESLSSVAPISEATSVVVIGFADLAPLPGATYVDAAWWFGLPT